MPAYKLRESEVNELRDATSHLVFLEALVVSKGSKGAVSRREIQEFLARVRRQLQRTIDAAEDRRQAHNEPQHVTFAFHGPVGQVSGSDMHIHRAVLDGRATSGGISQEFHGPVDRNFATVTRG